MKFPLLAVICGALSLTLAVAYAQSFSSGSTGADGALDLTSGDQTVQLPDSGILNYTTVNIPAGRTLTFKNNLQNTPVIMLVQGAVNIAGTISVAANGNTPGPGGFYGGAPGQIGFGPAPGQGITDPTANFSVLNGKWVGPLSLVPIIGASGNGGENFTQVGNGFLYPPTVCSGPGGGGAIVIASSSSIALSGSINASGGDARAASGTCGGSAADGAIRLIANTINVTAYYQNNFSASIVRLEAPLGAVSYAGNGTAPVISTVNPEITPANPPVINIVSIGGYPVPSYSGSSFTSIDLMLPAQLQDPIPVVVHATNVPVGSTVTVSFSGSSGATSTTADLAGSNASSTATVYVSSLNRSSVTYLFASTTFDASLLAANFPQTGPNAVSKIELASAPGEKTKYRFLRKDGSEISLLKVPSRLKHLFGL